MVKVWRIVYPRKCIPNQSTIKVILFLYNRLKKKYRNYCGSLGKTGAGLNPDQLQDSAFRNPVGTFY